MTTILAINAICTLSAGFGLGGYLVLADRRARRDAGPQPVFVFARTTRPLPPG